MGTLKAKQIKVELGTVQDIEALITKATTAFANADSAKKIFDAQKTDVTNQYSRALIITDANIPAQCDAAIKKAQELGADDTVSKLMTIKSKALDLTKKYSPIYNSLK
jgi:hypothetical protein